MKNIKNLFSMHTKRFTLIEMMVVIGVIIFVAAITLPGIMPLWRSQNVRSGKMIIQNGITAARAYAIRNKVICALGVYNFYDEGELRGAINLFTLEGAQARYWIGNPGASSPIVDNWNDVANDGYDDDHADDDYGDDIDEDDIAGQDGTPEANNMDSQENANYDSDGDTSNYSSSETTTRLNYIRERLVPDSWKQFPFGVSAYSINRPDSTHSNTVQYVAMVTFYSNGSMIPPGTSPSSVGFSHVAARIEKGSSDYTLRGWRIFQLTGHLKSSVDGYVID